MIHEFSDSFQAKTYCQHRSRIHPNDPALSTVRYYEGYEDPQHIYLVVDLVEGPPLLEMLANHSKLTFQIIAKFCKDILEVADSFRLRKFAVAHSK